MNNFFNDNLEENNTEKSEAPMNWDDSGDELREAEMADQAYSINIKTSNRPMIILLATCIIGMLAVYLFGVRQKPQPPAEEQVAAEAQLDLVLAKLVSKKQAVGMISDTEKMVKTFYQFAKSQQVKLEELQKNPFSQIDSNLPVVESTVVHQKFRDKLKKDLDLEVTKLQLQSVIQGARGSNCLINGEVYSVGQTIGDSLKIKTINVDSVVLEAQGFEFTLAI